MFLSIDIDMNAIITKESVYLVFSSSRPHVMAAITPHGGKSGVPVTE